MGMDKSKRTVGTGGMLLGVGSSICALTTRKSMESYATGEAVVADHSSIALELKELNNK